MFKKQFVWLAAGLLVLSVVVGACTPAVTQSPPAPTQAPAVPTQAPPPTKAPPPTEVPTRTPTETPTSPLAAVDPHGQTVIFWHVWGQGQPSEGMAAIVEEFNKANEWGITVEALDQGRYNDLEDKMNAAIQSGDLPDLVVGYANALSNWYSVGSMVDLNGYIGDSLYGYSEEERGDFYQGAMDAAKLADGAQVGFPISLSANVLFYNHTWAKELGFEAAPATPEEFKAQACAAAEANNNDASPDNDGTGGLVLFPGASNVASWVFAYGGNMLTADGTGYDFTSQPVQDVAAFWKDLWDSKCAFATESYPNPEFATRRALFTMSSTAGIPYQVAAFEDPAAIKDEWSLIPFPGPKGAAVDDFGQIVGVVNTTPEKDLAAWLFVKYFTSPEVQSKWIEASAYYPTRDSTVPLLKDYAAKNVQWGTGLAFLPQGQSEPNLASWTAVRRAVQDAFNAILQGTPDKILDELTKLNEKAAEAVKETG